MAGPSVWNSLPGSLRNPIIGGNSFRQSLKTFLFATYPQHIRGFTTMRYMTFYLLTYLLTYLSPSCTGFLCGSASCSRLRLSSTGPCPATPRVTWPTTVRSSLTPVSDNCVLLTLEHSSARRAAVLETRPLPPQHQKSCCRPISLTVGGHVKCCVLKFVIITRHSLV